MYDVLGIQTQGGSMVGADDSTEPLRDPYVFTMFVVREKV